MSEEEEEKDEEAEEEEEGDGARFESNPEQSSKIARGAETQRRETARTVDNVILREGSNPYPVAPGLFLFQFFIPGLSCRYQCGGELAQEAQTWAHLAAAVRKADGLGQRLRRGGGAVDADRRRHGGLLNLGRWIRWWVSMMSVVNGRGSRKEGAGARETGAECRHRLRRPWRL